MRHLITLEDVPSEQIQTIFALSADLKAKFIEGIREALLPGRVMAMLFEKQSLRTRVSFQAGMAHLGGTSMMLGEDAGFGKRESIADFTHVLSAMVDVIVVRAKAHATVEAVAEHSACSVINGLTDFSHPCQALADLFTMREQFGTLDGAKLTWVGDANNVARSLAFACAKLDVDFAVACPANYAFTQEETARLQAMFTGSEFICTEDPQAAVSGASAVYTDVWASMGQEAEQEQRRKDFAAYQVNEKLMSAAPDEAVFMHCLPAKRGQEVTDGVMDSSQSVIVEQAANRMHVQKGVLAWLLGVQG